MLEKILTALLIAFYTAILNAFAKKRRQNKFFFFPILRFEPEGLNPNYCPKQGYWPQRQLATANDRNGKLNYH
jgi:hypothetical protein